MGCSDSRSGVETQTVAAKETKDWNEIDPKELVRKQPTETLKRVNVLVGVWRIVDKDKEVEIRMATPGAMQVFWEPAYEYAPSDINDLMNDRIEMVLAGAKHEALLVQGPPAELRWSDGEVWTKPQASPSEAQESPTASAEVSAPQASPSNPLEDSLTSPVPKATAQAASPATPQRQIEDDAGGVEIDAYNKPAPASSKKAIPGWTPVLGQQHETELDVNASTVDDDIAKLRAEMAQMTYGNANGDASKAVEKGSVERKQLQPVPSLEMSKGYVIPAAAPPMVLGMSPGTRAR